MFDSNKPENNQESKYKLVEDLKELHKIHLDMGPDLDDKAWNILRFTGAVFGLVVAIVTLNKETINQEFAALGLLIALVIHIVQLYFLWEAIKPEEYLIPPGTPSTNFSYENFVDTYILIDEEDYIDQKIIDYAGNEDSLGAIQIAKAINREKAKNIDRVTIGLMLIIIVLALTSIISIL